MKWLLIGAAILHFGFMRAKIMSRVGHSHIGSLSWRVDGGSRTF